MAVKNGEEFTVLNQSESCTHTDEVDDVTTERTQWSNRFQYILTLLGYSVGLGNLWRFPYICQTKRWRLVKIKSAFLIPYVIFTLGLAMPLFYLEVCLGQLSRQGPIGVWGLCPLMKGIGFSMMATNLLIVPYYSQVLTWAIYYLYKSFSPVLPWSTCGNTWNTPNCVAVDRGQVFNNTIYNATHDERINVSSQISTSEMMNSRGHTSTEEFWQYNTLGVSSGFGDFGSIQPHLVVCWLLACLGVFLCVSKGVKSLGKVVYVTALMPYLLLTVLLVKMCTMPGALDGILYYLTPDFRRLQHAQVWLEALVQLFFSVGSAWGPVIVMSSHSPSQQNAAWDTVIVIVAGELTSVFAGFVVFATVGFLAHSLQLPVAEVITSGPGIGFMVYPEAVSLLPVSQLWSVLFFLVLLMMGVDTVIGVTMPNHAFIFWECIFTSFSHVEAAVGCMEDLMWTRFRSRNLTTILGAVFVAYTFLTGLVFTTNGGIYLFQLLDWYTGAYVCYLISLLECVTVGWIYGIRRFSNDVELMTGKRFSMIFKIVTCIAIPVLLMVIIVLTVIAYKLPTYGDYVYPEQAAILGWFIATITTVPIPVAMVIQLIKQKGFLLQRVRRSLNPNKTWQRAICKYGSEKGQKSYSLKENCFHIFSKN